MIRKYCFALFFLLTLGACTQNNEDPVFYQNYIQAYYQGELKLTDWASIYAPGRPIDLKTTPIPRFYVVLVNTKRISRTPECLLEYERLAARNGDTGFNSWVCYSEGEMVPYAFADNFQTMHVVSDADWDEAHPAGTFLDDLLQCFWLSHADFVRNNYKGDKLYYTEKLISELTPDDMEMIDCSKVDVTISFTSPPTLAKTHTLTLRWTTVEGNVKTASITCIPEVDPDPALL